MTIGDGIAFAAICFSICFYRYIELRYSKIGKSDDGNDKPSKPH